MLRGDFSNKPSLICVIDCNILLSAIGNPVHRGMKRLFHSSRDIKPLMKVGAREWLGKNWETRFEAFVVGSESTANFVNSALIDDIAEIHHFVNKNEFLIWVKSNPLIHKVYTNNPELLGLDTVFSSHSGWSEVP